uniref:sal-like protein 3 isoform X2 n=1 Tax=Myxine glutinosa TaxID=7769 RepID=UPI00358EAAA8
MSRRKQPKPQHLHDLRESGGQDTDSATHLFVCTSCCAEFPTFADLAQHSHTCPTPAPAGLITSDSGVAIMTATVVTSAPPTSVASVTVGTMERDTERAEPVLPQQEVSFHLSGNDGSPQPELAPPSKVVRLSGPSPCQEPMLDENAAFPLPLILEKLHILQQQQLSQLRLIEHIQGQVAQMMGAGVGSSVSMINQADGQPSSPGGSSGSGGGFSTAVVTTSLSSEAIPSKVSVAALGLLRLAPDSAFGSSSRNNTSGGGNSALGAGSINGSNGIAGIRSRKPRPEDSPFKNICRYCGKLFGSDSALQIHIRSHTGERPFKCNVCGNRFSTRGNLKVHFQRHRDRFPHIEMNPYPVPEYLDTIISGSGLPYGMSVPPGEAGNSADEHGTGHESVGWDGATSESLSVAEGDTQPDASNTSMTSSLPPPPPYNDRDSAPTAVSWPLELRDRVQLASASDTFKLEQLVQSLEGTTVTSCEASPAECGVCHRVLGSAAALRLHLRLHASERPYRCKVCGRAFSTKANLRAHAGTHRGKSSASRPLHSCPICQKQFSNAVVLQQHVHLHLGGHSNVSNGDTKLEAECGGNIGGNGSSDKVGTNSGNIDDGCEDSPLQERMKSEMGELKMEEEGGSRDGDGQSSDGGSSSGGLVMRDNGYLSSLGGARRIESHVNSFSQVVYSGENDNFSTGNDGSHLWRTATNGCGFGDPTLGILNTTAYSMGDSSLLPPQHAKLLAMVGLSERGQENLGVEPATESDSVAVREPGTSTALTQRGRNTVCNICGKAFPYQSALEIHYRSHTKERPFVCPICQRGCSTKGNLKQHMLTHSRAPHEIFSSPPAEALLSLATHPSSDNGSNGASYVLSPQPPSSISAAAAAAATAVATAAAVDPPPSSSLPPPLPPSFPSTHHHQPPPSSQSLSPSISTQLAGSTVMTHSGPPAPSPLAIPMLPVQRRSGKLHACGTCGKIFSSASAVQVHARTHTGERPYACGICSRAFTTKGNLKVHTATHLWNGGAVASVGIGGRRGRRHSAEGTFLAPVTSTAILVPPTTRYAEMYPGPASSSDPNFWIQYAAAITNGLAPISVSAAPLSPISNPILASVTGTTPSSIPSTSACPTSGLGVSKGNEISVIQNGIMGSPSTEAAEGAGEGARAMELAEISHRYARFMDANEELR